MQKHFVSNLFNFLIAGVWIANGVFCKMLNLVPRHQAIVARILDANHARFFTFFIGIAETGMAIWILSGLHSRFNVIVQIIIIAVMNILEFHFAPDLLLWGKFNIIYALLFILFLYYKEFYLNKKLTRQKVCAPS